MVISRRQDARTSPRRNNASAAVTICSDPLASLGNGRNRMVTTDTTYPWGVCGFGGLNVDPPSCVRPTLVVRALLIDPLLKSSTFSTVAARDASTPPTATRITKPPTFAIEL